MRGVGVLLIALGACYAPSVVPGVPCDPVINNCPSGIECLPGGNGYTCGGGPSIIDAPIDAIDAPPDVPEPPGGDSDSDGIANASDNCPARANPNQHNEDTDLLGDVCDPCPISTINTDDDGDGVGNNCDPRPLVGGDTFVLFEPFAEGIPTGWTTFGAGTWSVGNDELRVAVGSGLLSAIRTNLVATTRNIVVASVVVEQMSGTNASVGIMNPHAPTGTDAGILCSLYQPTAGNRFISLYNVGGNIAIQNNAFAFVDNTAHILVAARDGTNYACQASAPMAAMALGTAAFGLANPTMGLRVAGTNARVQWLMIVRMP